MKFISLITVLEAVACKHCGQTQQVKRYGTTPIGTQRYRCYDCGRTFVRTYCRKACDPSIRKQIVPMTLNGAERVFGTPPAYWALTAIRSVPPLKKSQQVLDVHPAYSHKSLTLILKVDESCRAAGAVIRTGQEASPLAVTVGRCRGLKMQ